MSEVRYERLHPVELRERVASAPLAFVPIGTIEFHGEHLPFGVDGFEAHGICVRAAELAGGVVLPPLYLASGCLDLPFTLSFELTLVEQWVRATLRQLAHRGFRAVVVLTGHGPLDLNHLLKRVAAEIEQEHSEVSTYALCWLELNAARLSAPETGEPTCVDHAARVETSLMLALEPELVHLDRLSDDPTAVHEGIYGPNPRFTASREFGETQIRAGVELLAQRARDLLGGGRVDPFADLRAFVRFAWPERPALRGLAGSRPRLLIKNRGLASRYLSAFRIALDGEPLQPEAITLVNDAPGESGVPVAAASLGPENGFYLRRGQEAVASLGEQAVLPGAHRVELALGLGGVSELLIDEAVEFQA